MKKQTRNLGTALACVLCFSLLTTGCSLFGGSKEEPLDLPVMESTLNGVELKRDNQGLSDSDREHLTYAKEKWASFKNAFNEFGNMMGKYTERIRTDALIVTDSQDYVNTRDALIEACTRIEAVKPEGIPQGMKNCYDQLVMATNRARWMISQVEQKNGVNLPQDFNDIQPVITDVDNRMTQFTQAIENSGLEAAQASMPALDWNAESNRQPTLRDTFNVVDLGIRWGASRWVVMGVEGLRQNAFSQDTLSYTGKYYQYGGTRTYHFNEFGQLDSYTYDLNGADFVPPESPGDEVYNDIYEISAILEYCFVLDKAALKIPPTTTAEGNYEVVIDQPAETVQIVGNPNNPAEPIHITVTAKRADAAQGEQPPQ